MLETWNVHNNNNIKMMKTIMEYCLIAPNNNSNNNLTIFCIKTSHVPIGASKLRINWTIDLTSNRFRIPFPTITFKWGESNTYQTNHQLTQDVIIIQRKCQTTISAQIIIQRKCKKSSQTINFGYYMRPA
jgi:hypothetical protein